MPTWVCVPGCTARCSTCPTRRARATCSSGIARPSAAHGSDSLARRRHEPSAGEREGLAPRKKEPSAGEREGVPLARESPQPGSARDLRSRWSFRCAKTPRQGSARAARARALPLARDSTMAGRAHGENAPSVAGRAGAPRGLTGMAAEPTFADRDGYIWMNGELVDWREARVHVLTHTLHYGVGVFEGVRAYATPSGPSVFRLREHTDRLFDSAHILGIDDPVHAGGTERGPVRGAGRQRPRRGLFAPGGVPGVRGDGTAGGSPVGERLDRLLALAGLHGPGVPRAGHSRTHVVLIRATT